MTFSPVILDQLHDTFLMIFATGCVVIFILVVARLDSPYWISKTLTVSIILVTIFTFAFGIIQAFIPGLPNLGACHV